MLSEQYQQVKDVISYEEFETKVNDKVDLMAGLCDRETAAVMVINDLGISSTNEGNTNISDLSPDGTQVRIKAKIVSRSGVHEFERKDGSTGRVCNLKVVDETGSVQVALWDSKVELLSTHTLDVGNSITLTGRTRDGRNGTEINVGKNDPITPSEVEITAKVSTTKIKDIADGMRNIDLTGKILSISDIRTFNGQNGEGKVCNVYVGDDTGKINLTLWNEKTDVLKELIVGDSIEILNTSAKINNYNQNAEIQVGSYSVIRKASSGVEYKENFTPIADIKPGDAYSISGIVSDVGELKEFTKDDGSLNAVLNVSVQDDTGEIRVALWGDHAINIADEIDYDDRIEIIDAYSKEGFQNALELSVGNRSRVVLV